MPFETIGSPALWAAFLAFVLLMLAVDLGLHRKAHEVSVKEAATWSAVWIGLAAAFGGLVYWWFGPQRALEFATGYLIEKALAVDNLFVFIIIFSAFAVPAALQHRVLFWGILGALVMRAGFILAGGALLQRFHWLLYIFGAFLFFTGAKLLWQRNDVESPEENRIVRLVRRIFPVSEGYHGSRFTVKEGGKRRATPLLLALMTVELSDVVFAVDSIPAVYAVTEDPFIVFTSNIFAILGLRSLYSLLARVLEKFHLLKVGLALILLFVGAKMLVAGVIKVPIAVSLLVIAVILAGSMLASVWVRRREAREST
jgi:TerC family integral membrane protein